MFSFFQTPLKSRQRQFLSSFPSYGKTKILDKVRKTDFRRLDKGKHVYLDYTGGNLYPESLVTAHHNLLRTGVFGNPHSTNPASQSATKVVEKTRDYVLNYFNAGDDYFCIFTPNCSGALKIVGESYPFGSESQFLLTVDNHNSVNGIKEYAKNKGTNFKYSPLDPQTLYIKREALEQNLKSFPGKKNKLFAYPAQSNVSGIKHPLEYVKMAKAEGWDVLLDTAAFVPSSRLDLQAVQPDFATVSFYKIFGYPTGLGCLLVRKEVFKKLVKPWYAGGTVSVAAATFDGHFLRNNHERFEDGTLNYLTIPAVLTGLQYIEKITIDTIALRVSALSQWLIQQLCSLKHSNGQPLVKIFGAHHAENRGGTISMNLYRPDGTVVPFTEVESEANMWNISLRSGCFCNPGIDETISSIRQETLSEYFSSRDSGDICDILTFMGPRGSVRISLGLASNFNDVNRFYEFAQTFLQKARA